MAADRSQALQALRVPFGPEQVGQRGVITCGACKYGGRNELCEMHTKEWCDACSALITTAHKHVDYVGHADVTARLLDVDPYWSWEPLAYASTGLPLLDTNGGLWIKLTVCGVTRTGYGHAEGRRGGDAVKEAVGDAIRNAAMRAGVALDLWRTEWRVAQAPAPEPASDAEPEPSRNAMTLDALRARVERQRQQLGDGGAA